VGACALMRHGAAGRRHERPSHQNFSIRLCDTLRRYSLEPR
jgi:hypothetical protein